MDTHLTNVARTMAEGGMQATTEGDSTGDLASGAGQEWLGDSVWEHPELEISRIKSWASITAMSYHRGGGETKWRGDRHRIVLTPDQLPPMLVQIEQEHTRQMPLAAPGTLAFFPAGLKVRVVHPPARLVQVLWGYGFVFGLAAGGWSSSIRV